MARKQGLDDFLQFASTPRLRLAVTLAAVSFATCHVAVLATAQTPVGITADPNEIPRQLIHFVAVFCRFAMPLAFMVIGFAIRAKAARAGQPKG
jgi:hypothetical protein